MKKSLQRFLLMAFLLLVGSSAWALTPDLSMDYELVGYKADAFYDFSTNDPAVLPESGDLKFRSGYGLFNFGSGNRGGDVSISVKQGQVLVCQFSDTQNRGVTINSISGCTKSSTLSDGSHLFYVADEEQSTLNFNVGRGGCIVSLLVMDEDQSVTKASYTLNYINGELAVKSVNGEQAVGSTVPTDASFFVEDAKYIRKAGEPESFTIAEGENNFSVKVRPAETFNYSLLSSLGETLASGSGLEGEKVYAGYPRYQLSEGKFYEAGVTNKEYRKSIVLSEDNINATVDYAAWDGSNPVVFFAEGENIAGFTVSTANNIPARASNAKAGTASEDVEITALPAGKYILHVGTFTSKSSEQKIYIGYGENQYAFASSSNLNESASEEITLTEETAIKYFGTTSSTDAQFDYIWIEKTGEYVPVIYIVAGSSSEIFGQPWDPTYNANQMTMNANGTYSKTYTVEGSVDDVSLKVVRNGEEWFGDAEGFNVQFNLTGAGTFTVTFNPETSIVSVTGDIVEFPAVEYDITIADGIVGGTVVADPASAKEGDEVTLTATPDEGYEFVSYSVTGNHEDLAVEVTDGKFIMPADDVTVNATFRKVIYIETDLTSDFAALTVNTNWKNIDGGPAGYTSKDFCPKVTTNAGQTVQVCEYYRASCDFTGDVLSQTVTGLTPGVYKIELYGGAAFTFNRGFGSIAFTGDLSKAISDTYQAGDKIEPTTENPTGVSLTATTSEGVYGGEIPIFYATNFPEGASVVTIDGVEIGQNGTITLAISKESQSTNWHVIQLKGVTAKVPAVEALASAVAKAKAALNSEENAVIVGEERTALESAIENYSEVTELTAEAYKTAVEALQTATNTFTSAREAYATLASTREALVGYAEKYVYASADKAAAVTAAAEAVPTSAADATSINTNLITALRFMAESHAIAESVEGAEAIAITNPSAENNNIDGWTVVKGEGSGGNIDVKSNEPWTSADESTAHKYFDGGNWGASAWDVSLTQDVELEPGKYLLSAIGRASGDVALSLFAGEKKVAMPSIGAAGGIFNRGWNITSVEFKTDAKSTVTIGVQGVTEVIHNWMSFSDFKLVCLERYYAVNIAEGIENGTVVADPTMAAAGETVTLTVTPAEGYELASISVTGVTSNIAVEAQYDSWSGTAEFEMPADAVTVNATFQQAYVEVSDFAIASTGIFDEDGTVKVTGTFTPETAGSYTEMFFGDVIYDITVVPTAGGDAVQYTLNIPNDKTLADGVVSGYIPHLVPATNYTVYVDSVHVWDYLSYQEIFVVKAAEGEHLTSTTFTAMPQTELADLNVERYVGQGYTATTAEVDFSAAKTFLGVDEITSDMLYIINPDLSQIKDYAKYDGWFDGDGKAEIWGDKTKINVKFYQALTDGKYTICDMNGADVVDNTYTVRWALVNNFKAYVYTINVKFVEQPTVAPEIAAIVDVPVVIKSGTALEGATAAFNVLDVTGPLNLDAISDADQYIVNVTDGSFVVNSTDGWRDANGDAAAWGTAGEGMVCVKINDPASGIIDYLGAIDDSYEDGDTYTAKWGFVNKASNTAVILNINITFVTDPTGIDATPAADGVKPDGKYLENGKIVIYRNGNKYDASGAPMNK